VHTDVEPILINIDNVRLLGLPLTCHFVFYSATEAPVFDLGLLLGERTSMEKGASDIVSFCNDRALAQVEEIT